jgi:hypothetical protein
LRQTALISDGIELSDREPLWLVAEWADGEDEPAILPAADCSLADEP